MGKTNKIVNVLLGIALFGFLAVISMASLHLLIIMAIIGIYTITKTMIGGIEK